MTLSSKEFADRLRETDFSSQSLLLVGFGEIGKEYLKVADRLGITNITVCSRSKANLAALSSRKNVRTISGGYENLREKIDADTTVIIATPIPTLLQGVQTVVELGCRNLLIEKPVALSSAELVGFSERLEALGVNATVAYNRIGYPSLIEARYQIANGGAPLTLAHYEFTELSNRFDPKNYGDKVMSRWGIANSAHVMSLAHSLIGLPQNWDARCTGNDIAWHPTGSVFVGSGVSESSIPFTYFANWGGTGRWSVSVETKEAAYQFCPLEKLYCRRKNFGPFEEIPVTLFSSETKPGFLEQVATLLNPELRETVPLMSLKDLKKMTEYCEDVFGYTH